MKQTLVVIGNGMVGQHFLTSLVTNSHAYQIIVFGEEPQAAYDRVHLSEFFSGKTAQDLSMVEDGFFEQHEITIHLGDKIVEVNRDTKTVLSAKGVSVTYDKLVFATGSYPFVPPVLGHDRPNCLVYRTIADLEMITEAAKTSKIGTVVGGGLLGLEAAKALKDLGLETHVVEFAPRLMTVQLDETGGALLRQKIEALGVTVHTNRNTRLITAGEQCRNKMCFTDDTELETDIVLFSAGIRPHDALAKTCGLAIGARGGIVIDNNCKTSDPDIYAIGECAVWNGMIYGLVAPGYAMARTVVADLLGKFAYFAGADMSTKLKLMGVDVASIGDAQAKTPDALLYSYQNGAEGIYKRLVVSADNKYLLGAILVGDAQDYGTLLQYYLNCMELPENPENLILPASANAPVALGSSALPDSAQVCSCFDISKADICSAVAQGCSTLNEIKTQTKACTGCGGCTALVQSVLNAELSKQGISVCTDLCEHFAHTRQELFTLIQVEQLKTFDELITKHGKGLGCEICKPAVASILASQWNEHVLETAHVPLQDTNDTFLANMQKDGTYSIVPRVAGGEITPEKLIAIGQVAQKYQLYTKITGGQRIDLFGARLEQLPAIWSELIDAGFETGHAYAKSLRTVKSCVGSTWCRYGVADSTSLAIELENRYKGLRSPHKLKFGVSGCTRECAEAQSKDVGIIATEKGWNLYVCGNGGMKPRHADLIATGLNKADLIQLIDRFLSFYVRTAERLQRTSVWLDNLEGGLAYLQSVIIDDRLGLCEQLEQHIQHIVATYQCEWQTTVNDAEKLKRFQNFINTDLPDDHIVMVQERGQPRPATMDERKHFKIEEVA